MNKKNFKGNSTDVLLKLADSNSFLLHKTMLKDAPKTNQYGLMKYTYNEECHEEGYLDTIGTNLGDYVQSLAAIQFLPKVDLMVDRDQLRTYDGDPVNMIVNGWYYIWKKNAVFAENINPLFVAFHIANPKKVKEETLQYLKKHEPIGCRDYSTRNFLWSNGISAYFSGCLTFTLGKTYRVDDSERTDKIYFCDMEKIFSKFKFRALKNKTLSLLEGYDLSNVEHTKHFAAHTEGNSVEKRFEMAKELLYKYARAKLVVTSRIHCALPCLAMGTPVILVTSKYDSRYPGLTDFCNHIYRTRFGRIISRVELDKNKEIINSDKYKHMAQRLDETCESFIQNSSVNVQALT